MYTMLTFQFWPFASICWKIIVGFNPIFSALVSDNFLLLVVDERNVYQLDLNTSPPMAYEQLVTLDIPNDAYATAYHPLEQKIYWTDFSLEFFSRAPLDFSSVETFAMPG